MTTLVSLWSTKKACPRPLFVRFWRERNEKRSYENNYNVIFFGFDRSLEEDLYLLVHNIDGPMLRNDKSQSALAELAQHPKV